MRYLAIVLALSASSAVAQSRPAKGSIPKPGSVYVSIMGEPFRESETEGPFERWFKQADEDADGGITRLELQSDADYFFAVLDTNEDKVIDADEMDHYERVTAPAVMRAVGSDLGRYARSPRKGPQGSGRASEIPIVMEGMAETKSRVKSEPFQTINFVNTPHPIKMSDWNLDRRVTVQEFRATASKRFSRYDADHDGRLTRKELKVTQGSR